MDAPTLVVITGFMGCGKSVVARLLADSLDVASIDLDEIITEQEGKSPARIINEDGEKQFRLLETKHLRNILQHYTCAVIALGGGAWINERNRELINATPAVTVWIDTPFDLCWRRIEASGPNRPLGSTREQARALYEKRRATYGLAPIRVRTNGNMSQDLVANIVAAALRENSPSQKETH
ncbi:MAG: shikimate kinase [Pyrinomonadaceae bacterium]